MVRLTDVEEIAKVVSQVTERLCGATFEGWDPLARSDSLGGKIVMMSLEGPRRIGFALGCDARGGRLLAAALFRHSVASVTPRQVDDAIAELLTVVAREIQRVLGVDQPLGAPRRASLAELGALGLDDTVLLRSPGDVDLRLWVFEDRPVAAPAAAPTTVRGRLMSLVKRIGS